MALSLYDARDYKRYVNAWIESRPKGGRGLRKQLADQLRCQVGFITHVLSGDYHFSPEQAEGTARFMSLSRDESEFFLLLVQFNRAGTPELKAFLEKSLDDKSSQHRLLTKRLQSKREMSREDQKRYYSHWYFAAVQMLTSLPGVHDHESLAERLRVPKKAIGEALEFLVSRGFIHRDGAGYRSDSVTYHLGKDSTLIARHHSNWRLQALRSLEGEKPQDLHYSGVITCSAKDIPQARELFVKCLQEVGTLIEPSRNERAAALCLDFFEL